MELSALNYSDGHDKSFGLAGMAITLVACDGQELLIGIDMDDTDGRSLLMSPEFTAKGNPRMSAKLVWTQSLEHFKLATSMILGNLMCRHYILRHKALASDIADMLRSLARNEADELCALETDEADAIFNNCYNYVDRLFNHPGVRSIAEEFAEELRSRRNISASEIFDFLSRRGLD